METESYDRDMLKMESILLDDVKHKDMMSSTISVTSSLTSPVDSGVQLLDSESDLTSVMSASGFDLDKDPDSQADCDKLNEMFNSLVSKEITDIVDEEKHVMTKSDIANQNITSKNGDETVRPEDLMNVSLNSYELLDYTMANAKSHLKNIEGE